jgi:hypothetical protein
VVVVPRRCVEVRLGATVGSGATLVGGMNDRHCAAKNHWMCMLGSGGSPAAASCPRLAQR